jgi:hypothetical protein
VALFSENRDMTHKQILRGICRWLREPKTQPLIQSWLKFYGRCPQATYSLAHFGSNACWEYQKAIFPGRYKYILKYKDLNLIPIESAINQPE